MDRYQRVEKPREETPINENEIRITTQGRVRNYITYATTLFQEKGSREIVLKAMGRAINKTVMITELIKRRIAGLHQNTSIGSNDITDVWEPLEEGLLPLETTRHVSMITITLSKNELDTSSPGYQPPLAADQVKQWTSYDNEGGNMCLQFYMAYIDVHIYADPSNRCLISLPISEDSPQASGRGRGGRGRGRGRGNVSGAADYNGNGNWDMGGRGYTRGRGRGRGHNFRGGRGYGGSNMQGESGYNGNGGLEPRPSQGRGNGRGWGRTRGRGRRSEGPVQEVA